jgi:DNA (cytosine-5)-methyltransferase 1
MPTPQEFASLRMNKHIIEASLMNIQMKYSSLKVIDLFSGCGGLSLGFQKSGLEIVTAFENWKPAINVYQQNFHHPIFDYDLSQVNNN